MTAKRTLRLPSSQAFLREWLRDPAHILQVLTEGDSEDIVPEVVNTPGVTEAEHAAALVWYALVDSPHRHAGRDLAIQAGDRWIELMRIAAEESPDPTGADELVDADERLWAEVKRTFVGFRDPEDA